MARIQKRRRRGRRMVGAATARTAAVTKRGHEWVDARQPDTLSGVAVEAWRRYRAVDGPQQSALLSLYILVAVLPALLVMEDYLDAHPDALARHIVHQYGLNRQTAVLLHGVLSEGKAHELGAALVAIVSALVFGLGFGRVLQVVHARAWRLDLPPRLLDQVLFGGVLVSLYGAILLLLVQLTELGTSHRLLDVGFSLGWIALLVGFFVYAPWLLTHKLVSRRDLLPSAVLTALGLVVLMLVSGYVGQFWIDFYARDYGGFGVVLAIYFWIAFSSGTIVWAASLSPALAERRALRRRG